MASVQMISPPIYVYDAGGDEHTVFGWLVPDPPAYGPDRNPGRIQPIVANPDGPGVGPWLLYHGDDPWTIQD